MSKQDRQGVRTPADIERKYDLSGKEYMEIRTIATNAQKSAEKASRDISEHNSSESAHADIRKTLSDNDTRLKRLEENQGGDSGGEGGGGGYYTPAVTQPSDSTMSVAYTPSQSTMPSVAPVTINLPKGEKGDKGDTGETGPQGPPGNSADIEVLTIEEIRAICV